MRVLNKSGQTLVIALLVMFVLAGLAGVFIAIVGNNLRGAERVSRADAVMQIAQAGIRYADRMLTSSEDGADWRPEPDSGIATPGNPVTGTLPVAAADWQLKRDRWPDFKWLRAYWPTELPAGSPDGAGFAGPGGGFSKFDTGQGRFLLRVTYNPTPADPLSKYIKIESIGRWGVFDDADPTTWKPSGNVLLRQELTAYKPIGITDYARFITNKDDRSSDMSLSCPGYEVFYGRENSSGLDNPSRFGPRGGSVRVNGNAVWAGNTHFYLREAATTDPAVFLPLDKVEASGTFGVLDTTSLIDLTRMDMTGGASTNATLLPSKKPDGSDNPSFTTAGGFYRDGSDYVDVDNLSRGVKRLEPPLVTQPDITNTTTRYSALTLNSGKSIQRGGRWYNQGRYGWGRGIYIDNANDVQKEQDTLFGSYSLRSDWLNPDSRTSPYWVGSYYFPPGVVITLMPNLKDSAGQPCFTMTRSDKGRRGAAVYWRDASGIVRRDWGTAITMPYPDPANGRKITYTDDTGTHTDEPIEGNGVIYAEGNIRVRGMLPPGMQLTIVSNQNIYIEGNILKYRKPGKEIANDDPWRGADETCSLALLARKYVCVNTTQFCAPVYGVGADDVGSDANDGAPPYHLIVSSDPSSRMRFLFGFGPWESETGALPVPATPTIRRLLVRHAGDTDPAYVDYWLNPGDTIPDWGILWLNPGVPGYPNHVYGVGDPRFTVAGWGVRPAFVGNVLDLTSTINANLYTEPSFTNFLDVALDQAIMRSNYLLGGVNVQPSDVRIEALIYAEQGSFFVIPGYWFNPDPRDRPGATRLAGYDPAFPYYGDALDIRIIIDGAVSENIPAAVSDVEKWMEKWGRIPDTYGSSAIPTAHPGEGLCFLYDDHAGWPLSNLRAASGQTPIRSDRYGRPLPFAPRLPVSSSVLYSGDVL